MTRLFSRISEPSTAARGVESWIASLAATRASLSAPPGSAAVNPILATSGPSSPGSSAKLSPDGASLRTSQVTFPWDFGESSPSWKQWVTELRLDFSRRQKSARAIGGSASSSWPTARASEVDGRGAANRTPGTGGKILGQEAREWQTPNGCGAETRKQVGATERENLLGGQAKAWATPNAHDGRRPGVDEHSTQGGNLQRDAAVWPTPRTSMASSGSDSGSAQRLAEGANPGLKDAAQGWPTPGANDFKGTARGGAAQGSVGRSSGAEIHEEQVDESTGARRDAPREGSEADSGGGERLPWSGRDELPRFPPGPGDLDAWRRILDARPDLAPALTLSEEEAFARLRGVAHGVAGRVECRADRLRLLGNGVVPDEACAAFIYLHRSVTK